MNYTPNEAATKELSLLDALEDTLFKFPFQVMQDVGPAVRTLSGLLRITNKQTFVKAEEIAKRSRVPLATARKHLDKLHERGWIENKGREYTPKHFLRRTATVAVTKKTRESLEPYGLLPWWADGPLNGFGKLKWSGQAMLSFLMAEIAKVKRAVEEAGGDLRAEIEEPEQVPGVYEDIWGTEHFSYSTPRLMKQTGLSRHSVIEGKRALAEMGVIRWFGQCGDAEKGQASDADYIAPDWLFRITITPSGDNRCIIRVKRSQIWNRNLKREPYT